MRFYVIMPVGSDELFMEKRSIIQSEARKAGFTAYFPLDEQPNIPFDLSLAIKDLRDSQFVLADLSLERPSCYFELGLAQALGKPTLLVAEEGTPIHQANGRNQVKFYADLEEYRRVLSETLVRTGCARGVGNREPASLGDEQGCATFENI